MWNRISEKLKESNIEPKNATVVYLPGPKDRDRPIAIGKGFNANNLIAIDSDEKIITQLKSEGKIAYNGMLSDVLVSYPKKIDVVFADMCGGLSRVTFSTLNSIVVSSSLHGDSVIAVNLLRGRENGKALNYLKYIRHMSHCGKHRGHVLFCAYVNEVFTRLGRDGTKAWLEHLKGLHVDDVIEHLLKPSFYSYKSDGSKGSNLYMDSVIFKRNHTMPTNTQDFIRTYPELKKHYRSLIALEATRTKRKTGVLPHCPHF